MLNIGVDLVMDLDLDLGPELELDNMLIFMIFHLISANRLIFFACPQILVKY